MRRFGASVVIAVGLCACSESTAPPAGYSTRDRPDASPGDGDGDGDGDEPADATADEEPEPSANENPLIGVWNAPGSGSCTYTHVFDDEGHYQLTSTSGEVIEATYDLAPPDANMDRWLLRTTFLSDNNAVDCEGDMLDEDGAMHAFYLELSNGDDQVDLFTVPEGGGSVWTWTRER